VEAQARAQRHFDRRHARGKARGGSCRECSRGGCAGGLGGGIPRLALALQGQLHPPKPIKSLADLGNHIVAGYIDVSARNSLVPALLAISTAADVLEKATG
jgi:hypothetical protein